jgi:hypothetical protein
MSARSCDALGVCQSRTPACTGCRPAPAFAPGTIEGPFPNERQAVRLMRIALVWAVATGTLAAVMFAIGLLA